MRPVVCRSVRFRFNLLVSRDLPDQSSLQTPPKDYQDPTTEDLIYLLHPWYKNLATTVSDDISSTPLNDPATVTQTVKLVFPR
jgi:hypothetical protein